MANAFRDPIKAQAAKIREHAGVEIVYTTDDGSVTIEKAIKFPQRKRAVLDQTAIDTTIQDWGIGVEDLELPDAAITPARGHTITFDGDTYEVLPQDGDSVAYLTAADSQWRIHTKRTVT